MTALTSQFRTALRKRRDYARTLRELRALPLDAQLDLDLYRGDAHRIARRAVYGR